MAEKIPIACTLPPDGAAAQIDEWVDLRRFALGAEALPTGARLRFPAELLDRVTDLAEREAACCSFLDIAVDQSGDAEGEVVLEVTSTNPEALPVIAVVAGVEHR